MAHINGRGQCVLLAERLILNVLARCSGVATRAGRIQKQLRQFGWNGSLAGSRKTTPGFRLVEKYGLMVANVDPHRYDLGSMVWRIERESPIFVYRSHDIHCVTGDVERQSHYHQRIDYERYW